ncbi:MAG: hypothetical protein AABW67_04605 [Nanoarchaeota archaeon]
MKHIDNLVEKLKQEYTLGTEINWNNLAKDKNIGFLVDKRVIIPFSFPNPNFPQFVFTSPSIFKKEHFYNIAHEFGHVLLNSYSEEEADYFANKILGYKAPQIAPLIDMTYKFFRHPVNCLSLIFGRDKYMFKFGDKLIKEINV